MKPTVVFDETGQLARLGVPFAQSFAADLDRNAKGMAVLDSEESRKIVQFLPYDPRRDCDRFAMDLYFKLKWWLERTVVFRDPLADYAERFGIIPVPLRPNGQLLEPAPQWRAMVRWHGGSIAQTTMVDLVQDVAEIPLIPSVPEDAQATFRRGTALYVYGYLYYEFLTLAPLVAYMALEAALRYRWCQAFRSPVRLRLPHTKKKSEAVTTLDSLTHERAIEWCRSQERSPRELLVEEQPFPATFRQLLDRLVEWGVLTLWERKEAEQGWQLRGSLAHPEESMTLWSGFALGALRRAALIINRLYDPERDRPSASFNNTAPA